MGQNECLLTQQTSSISLIWLSPDTQELDDILEEFVNTLVKPKILSVNPGIPCMLVYCQRWLWWGISFALVGGKGPREILNENIQRKSFRFTLDSWTWSHFSAGAVPQMYAAPGHPLLLKRM